MNGSHSRQELIHRIYTRSQCCLVTVKEHEHCISNHMSCLGLLWMFLVQLELIVLCKDVHLLLDSQGGALLILPPRLLVLVKCGCAWIWWITVSSFPLPGTFGCLPFFHRWFFLWYSISSISMTPWIWWSRTSVSFAFCVSLAFT